MHPNLKVNKKVLAPLFILILSASFLFPFQLPSSAQTNVCPANLIRNGDFATGVVVVGNGNFPPSTVPFWSTRFQSPQVGGGMGCGNNGFVSMWGNKTVGEAMQQTLTTQIQNGHKYRLTACAKWYDNNNPVLPKYVRFRVRASQGQLPSYTASGPTTPTIGVLGDPTNAPSIPAPGITSTSWTTLVAADWTATGNYDTVTINPENDNTANDGNTVSWGQIDNVCIQEIFPPVIEGPDAVCQNQQAVFHGSATGGTSWNWNFGDGGTSTLQNPTHPYSTPGTFPVKLCVNGTTNCTIKNIVVNALPAAPVITGPASSCGNQNATYSVLAVAGVTYSWTVTNGTINGSSTGASVNVTWNTTGVGVIAVTVTNKAGCSVTVRKEVIGCDPHLPCCKDFFAKTDLKSLTDAGNNIYNFTPTLSVNLPGPYVRVTADIIGANVTYSSPNCGKPGSITATIVGANPSNPGGFNGTVPISSGGEALWWSNSGANVNGVDFPMQIALPPAPAGHCTQYVTICIKYTFTNKECKTCEVIRCYSFKRGGLIKDLTEITEIKAER